MTRHIPFEGIHNFRDFGGYPTADGGRMATGRYYRSASHHMASDADLDRLSGLGLAVIVDLRQPAEREREPSRRWPGFAVQVVDNPEAELRPDFHGQIADADLSPQWFRDHAIDFYSRAPYEPRHVDLFRRYFQALAGTEGALLVHCAAGKDRTGLICALTHHVAGVHPDDILADYLLTNDDARMAERIAFIGEWMEQQHGRRASDEALRIGISVDAAYLERAFATIAERQGSLDAYLGDTLGIDGEARERLRRKLLA
jgi:protein tyrosine/serine phosphatase